MQSRWHQAPAPGLANTGPTHSPHALASVQSTANTSSPITTVDQATAAEFEDGNLFHTSTQRHAPNNYVMGVVKPVSAPGTMPPSDERISDLFPKWDNLLDLDVDIGADLGPTV